MAALKQRINYHNDKFHPQDYSRFPFFTVAMNAFFSMPDSGTKTMNRVSTQTLRETPQPHPSINPHSFCCSIYVHSLRHLREKIENSTFISFSTTSLVGAEFFLYFCESFSTTQAKKCFSSTNEKFS